MIGAQSKARIACRGCSAEVNVEAKQIGHRDAYEYCPLCGSDDVDVMLRS